MSARNISLYRGIYRKLFKVKKQIRNIINYVYYCHVVVVYLNFDLISCFRESLSPAILSDFSYNGTFVNGEKIGKGNSRVLDDNDEISVTHPIVKSKTLSLWN